MPTYQITYKVTTDVTYRIRAASETEAHRKWQEQAFFDLDRFDFRDGAASREGVELVRLEMLGLARDFNIYRLRESRPQSTSSSE